MLLLFIFDITPYMMYYTISALLLSSSAHTSLIMPCLVTPLLLTYYGYADIAATLRHAEDYCHFSCYIHAAYCHADIAIVYAMFHTPLRRYYRYVSLLLLSFATCHMRHAACCATLRHTPYATLLARYFAITLFADVTSISPSL